MTTVITPLVVIIWWLPYWTCEIHLITIKCISACYCIGVMVLFFFLRLLRRTNSSGFFCLELCSPGKLMFPGLVCHRPPCVHVLCVCIVSPYNDSKRRPAPASSDRYCAHFTRRWQPLTPVPMRLRRRLRNQSPPLPLARGVGVGKGNKLRRIRVQIQRKLIAWAQV